MYIICNNFITNYRSNKISVLFLKQVQLFDFRSLIFNGVPNFETIELDIKFAIVCSGFWKIVRFFTRKPGIVMVSLVYAFKETAKYLLQEVF